MTGLALAFFATALLYAAVGFGGGSTYNALLVLGGVDYRAIPSIALACNILVVTVGSWRFARNGYVHWARIWPLFAVSVPMAWLGGRLVVPEIVFTGLLALSLLAAAAAMLLQPVQPSSAPGTRRASWTEAAIGGAIGFLAGVVGIGGGIFLAPVLHLRRWDGPKVIAGTCALFILVNSLAGLAGQLAKPDGYDRLAAFSDHLLLFPAVVVGGLIGAILGSQRLKPRLIAILTALLILYVAARLALRFLDLARIAAG